MSFPWAIRVPKKFRTVTLDGGNSTYQLKTTNSEYTLVDSDKSRIFAPNLKMKNMT